MDNVKIYPGLGLRFIHKKIYNAIFRIDYGYGITKDATKGLVFGSATSAKVILLFCFELDCNGLVVCDDWFHFLVFLGQEFEDSVVGGYMMISQTGVPDISPNSPHQEVFGVMGINMEEGAIILTDC